MKNKSHIFIAFLITFIYFLIHLAIINDYGVSWDFHYHFYAGLYHLGLPVPFVNELSPMPFTPPDPRLTVADPFGPFTQIIPTLSHQILFEKLHLFPFDSAYNFPMVIFGSLGVGLLFVFVAESMGFVPALISALFLAMLPSYFGYLHNNMKDIPNAFAFTLSIYTFWKLVQKRKLKYLIFAVLSFAFAFNVKINSVLVPVICLIWYILSSYSDLLIVFKGKLQLKLPKKFLIVILYFLISPVAALVIWWPFWQNPLSKLRQLPYFYTHNTLNMPVLLLGRIFHSGVDIPWYYPYLYIGITTPLPILISFILGFLICLYNLPKKNKLYLLLVIWFFFPLLRYFNPKSGAIDGVRHFMEIVYPLSFIAGIGAFWLYKEVINRTKEKAAGIILVVMMIIIPVRSLIHYHPYQTSYFNLFIGGIKGASGKMDIDFWGTPQKTAAVWLNNNAFPNSTIHIVMAQSSAGMYLREDLQKNLNTKNVWESDYTVILNRQSFFSVYSVEDYIKQKTKEEKLVFTKMIDGVPLVWIFRK